MTDTRTETTGTGTSDGGTAGSRGGSTGGGTNGGGGRERSRAAEAYESSRAKTSAAFSGVRERAAGAGRRTAEEISANPMAAVAGGLAVGALLAALLPRTEREAQLLGGVGGRINDAAREAARSAADAGRAQVEELTENAATRVGEAVIGAVTATAGGGSDKS
ncbi:MAG TPA: hypothetical protein VGB08_03940 [Allosphingosinicella sp.]|jgi:ElaB/YqjD/DUF883 family membrane-anchored ribosome-binding protein